MRSFLLISNLPLVISWLDNSFHFLISESMQNTLVRITITPTTVSSAVGHTQSSTNAQVSIDPTVLVGIIGAGATILAVLITGIFMIYQGRRTDRNAEKIVRLQQELERQSKARDQEELHEVENSEKLREATLLTKINEERVDFYRQTLLVDPKISCVQILSMSRPLKVTDVYIRVRLHEDTRSGYELEPTLLPAEHISDPNMLLKSSQKHLENKFNNALEPDEAIRRFHHCVILGDPGAGKTTLLKYLAIKSAEKQLPGLPDLPIHISLNDFVSSGHSDLLDFAAMTWDKRYCFPLADARAYIEDRLKRGQALLLLDALDETVEGNTEQEAETSYKRIADTIIQAKTRYHQSPIVVTVRKAGYYTHVPLVGFTEVEILEFRPEDIEQFITRWFAFYQSPHKKGNAADLNGRLKRTPRIQELATNPLLLSLIVLVYQAELELPDRRAKLYKKCVDILLSEWDINRGILRWRDFKPEYKQQLLGEVAWHFHQQGQRYFPDSEVRAVIADFLPTVNLSAEENGRVLEEIANENGLLKEQAQGWHGFLHLTLQEYFVANYINDHQELEALLKHRGDPWWEDVLQLYAGQVPDASPLFQHLLEQSSKEKLPEDIFHTNLLIAGRCLVVRPKIKRIMLREQIITCLFELLRSTPYSLMRELVSETLTTIGGKEVTSELLRLLLDGQLDINVRGSIARAVGTLRDKSIAPELLHLLLDGKLAINMQGDIARAVGMLGDKSIAPELLQLLADGQTDVLVRQGIAQVLGTLGDKSIAPELLRLLADGQMDVLVRQGIAGALGTLGDKSIVPELLRLLSDGKLNINVRGSIARVLRTLGDKSIAPELLRLLADDGLDADMRGAIAGALGTLGDKSIAPELLRLLADSGLDRSIGWVIAATLGKLGNNLIIPELLQLLLDVRLDVKVRQGIARALGTLGDKSVVPELLQLLLDEHLDRSVRWEIVRALQQLVNNEDDIKVLAIHLSTSDIADNIYRGLWMISQRMKVRIIIIDETAEKHVELIKW